VQGLPIYGNQIPSYELYFESGGTAPNFAERSLSMNVSLLIDPKTGEEFVNVPTEIAAQFLGINRHKLCDGLETGRLPVGAAWKTGAHWVYHIPCGRLKAYALGLDISIRQQLINKTA
jgi:hypothetical protein